ncbi:hypothetical protein OIDMADRAFT_120288 [Oidiodendron maius Zn]|uniref:Cytochrome P450 n=1 Tax=Oidiodendron maius (strain Zn) TaxID=913774 RepID=A0A0C3CW90_OIDMZ|nr:hypothetical protein OIDMADRAFT_120288 [Oidiodendron maius Zn]
MDVLTLGPPQLASLYGGAVLVALSALVVGTSIFTGRSKYPAGPRPLGLVGNVSTFLKLLSEPDKELLRIRQRWGSICMLWYGSSPVIIINTPKAAKELLQDRGAIYASRPEDQFRGKIWPWRILTTPVGDEFRYLRKLYHGLLGPRQLPLFRQYQDYESKVTLVGFLDNPTSFLHDTERFALSIIFSAVYGVRIPRSDHAVLVEFFAHLDINLKFIRPGSLPVDYIPALQYLPLFLQPWHHQAVAIKSRDFALHSAVLDVLRKAMEADRAPECFGKMLLEIQKKEVLDNEQVLHILAMLIGAGSETTSSILQSFFKIMALHPECVKKAHEELDRVIGLDRLPTWDDQPSLPYLRSLIKEIHRWGLNASLGIPHATTQDDFYEGKLIPKGTICFPNLIALSNDPDRYPNPEIFNPDRFEHDDVSSAASAISAEYLQRDHFHYGFGRRLCQGIHIAESSLFIFISRVLWGFNIEPVEGCTLDMSDKISEYKPIFYR